MHAVHRVLEVVFGERAKSVGLELASLLSLHDLREHFRERGQRGFFATHIKRYSQSRRSAPIYWRLGVPSGRYSIFLNACSATPDVLFKLQQDYLVPRIRYEEGRLVEAQSGDQAGRQAQRRRAISVHEETIAELRAFEADLKLIAPLWHCNSDDGVVVNFAPLWRLVPHHKAWQKDLRATWDSLCVGHYDWAHLAMHLWPERVVPKCATERSLAIAHGLEDVFWVEGADRKWKARPTPLKSVEELVRERSSPAVKAALKSLLDAPTASGAGGARGRRRASSI